MSNLSRFLIILFAVCALNNCAPPLGSISGMVPYESIWVIPYRDYYIINDLFVPEEDVLVFGSFRGSVLPIDINDVTIYIADRPEDLPNDRKKIHPDPDGYHLFDRVGEGRQQVIVVYGAASTRYSIQVEDPFNREDPNIGGGGFGIIWWDGSRL